MPRILNAEIVPVLQTAIGPVILISGIGLLLLTMTNRLGRTIDRARGLAEATPDAKNFLASQLGILWSRARLLRNAILCASLSVLFAAMLVISLFLAALGKVEMGWVISALFIGGMLSLIASLALFIRDINLSLEALRMELRPHKVGWRE